VPPRPCRIVIAGFGNVGRSLVKLILEREGIIRDRYGIDIVIVGIADSSGFVIDPEGFGRETLTRLLEAPRGGLARTCIGMVRHDVVDVIDETVPDFLLDLTPANYDTGEPGLTYIVNAIRRGVNVVTANKAPLVLKYDYLMSLSRSRNVKFGYRATVFGGVPVIDVLRHLSAHRILKVEGIVNATTNYILSRVFYDGLSLSQAIDEARRIGVMEANPALDLEGIDAAAKIAIIANTLGISMTLKDVERIGITSLSEEEIDRLRKEGKVVKLIAELDVEKRRASVRPVPLDSSDDLAQVKYLLNAVRIVSDLNNIVIKGVGGGPAETAVNVLSELIELACQQ